MKRARYEEGSVRRGLGPKRVRDEEDWTKKAWFESE